MTELLEWLNRAGGVWRQDPRDPHVYECVSSPEEQDLVFSVFPDGLTLEWIDFDMPDSPLLALVRDPGPLTRELFWSMWETGLQNASHTTGLSTDEMLEMLKPDAN